VVLFTADNGGLSVKEGPNTPATSNAPLRAGKGYLYEGGIREPFLIRWPGVNKAGDVCDVPVCSIDFYPTILEMTGAGAGPKQTATG
jgi:arylsulfatase A